MNNRTDLLPFSKLLPINLFISNSGLNCPLYTLLGSSCYGLELEDGTGVTIRKRLFSSGQVYLLGALVC